MLSGMRLGWVLACLSASCAVSPPSMPAAAPRPTAAAERGPSKRSAPAAAEPVGAPPSASPAESAAPSATPRFREPLVARSETRAVVLLYHKFNQGNRPLSVRATDLDDHLGWLAEHHVEIVSTSELVRFLQRDERLPARVAVITIDDGFKSVFEFAWPVLRRRGARFTLGIPTGMLESPRNAPVMSWDDVREMLDSGLCEVASHGHMHRSLAGLSGRKLEEELVLSRQIISQRTGRAPVAYFYPMGAFDPFAAKAVAKAGYPAAFRASGAPIVAGGGSSFWLPRVSVSHGQTSGAISGYYGTRFLGQVAYSAKRDAGAAEAAAGAN